MSKAAEFLKNQVKKLFQYEKLLQNLTEYEIDYNLMLILGFRFSCLKAQIYEVTKKYTNITTQNILFGWAEMVVASGLPFSQQLKSTALTYMEFKKEKKKKIHVFYEKIEFHGSVQELLLKDVVVQFMAGARLLRESE